MKLRSFEVCSLALLVLAANAVMACGPFFPNNLLDAGDQALLAAPLANFERELQRMRLVESRFLAVPLPQVGSMESRGFAGPAGSRRGDFATQTLDAELSDLTAALKQKGLPEEKIEEIRRAHQTERAKLKDYVAAHERWERSGEWHWDENGRRRDEPKGPAPRFPKIEFVESLPAEFSDYLEGASAWHNPALVDKGMAREAWERLLARPAAERKFKSTWAAFMLAKSWEKEEPEKALACYQQVRELARRGFVDSLGLAAASLGWEARIHYQRKDHAPAIKFYLEHFATGDATAIASLHLVAAAALSDPESLAALASDARARQVITAFLISSQVVSRRHSLDLSRQDTGITLGWLNAVEAQGVTDVESAEKLALAAYQSGAYELAQRWIKRAPGSPLAQWLQAKIFLRAGKVDDAAALVGRVSRSFPTEFPGTNAPTSFAESLSVEVDQVYHERIPVGRQVLGELGVLRLARREYIQALDALLRSGYWMDAAYVAERVLTVDELKGYVDRAWPVARRDKQVETDGDGAGESVESAKAREQIRYLLARRLTRQSQGDVARDYFPQELRADIDTLVQALNTGWNESVPAEQRAKALVEAAMLARFKGMELLGTELEPDWHYHEGSFEDGVTVARREERGEKQAIVASEDELRRARGHKPDPDVRFHYRYQAAFLAWEAAKLMPDNSDETARVLCRAGSWIKYVDPPTADIFYKALVRRCRKTAIGDQADRMRWFPVLDEQGNPKPYTPRRERAEPLAPEVGEADAPLFERAHDATGGPLPGAIYVIHQGDTVSRIVSAARQSGHTLTVPELMAANPELDAGRLRVGQRILIPPARD
ncbi:MAG: LysM peptidoglycan-binding domain-containing protein [Verrucomicrobia bacterium]|nr:LysM peptidoglycan-binding domain-containing protein [Verrucomicrobiota bacterium]